MSYMNLLETNARYSVAISVLNSFRHWLAGREGAEFTDDDQTIFLESVEMNQDEKLSPKMILYSFQGFSDSEHSASIELSDALSKALVKATETTTQEELLNKFKGVLESKNKDSLLQTDKDSIMTLIINTMQILSSETEQKPKSVFTWKNL
jgi:hypothetical protein